MIEKMQREHEDRLRLSRRWLIAETDEGFEVHQWTSDGVAPWTIKETKETAAARLIQLMLINHAIVPQSWPEWIEIGTVTIEPKT
jgi:hypothetical protein